MSEEEQHSRSLAYAIKALVAAIKAGARSTG